MAGKCKQCGCCCKNMIIEVLELDLVREPRLKEYVSMYAPDDISDMDGILNTKNGCPFLKDNKCEIYPTRPTVCVAFEPGCDQCLTSRGEMPKFAYME